jgi:hypothetical protein
MQLPLPQRFTKENHPWPLEENKPNQRQFQNRQNEDKYSSNKGLCKSTTNNEQRTIIQNKPNQTQFRPRSSESPLPPWDMPRRVCESEFPGIGHRLRVNRAGRVLDEEVGFAVGSQRAG